MTASQAKRKWGQCGGQGEDTGAHRKVCIGEGPLPELQSLPVRQALSPALVTALRALVASGPETHQGMRQPGSPHRIESFSEDGKTVPTHRRLSLHDSTVRGRIPLAEPTIRTFAMQRSDVSSSLPSWSSTPSDSGIGSGTSAPTLVEPAFRARPSCGQYPGAFHLMLDSVPAPIEDAAPNPDEVHLRHPEELQLLPGHRTANRSKGLSLAPTAPQGKADSPVDLNMLGHSAVLLLALEARAGPGPPKGKTWDRVARVHDPDPSGGSSTSTVPSIPAKRSSKGSADTETSETAGNRKTPWPVVFGVELRPCTNKEAVDGHDMRIVHES